MKSWSPGARRWIDVEEMSSSDPAAKQRRPKFRAQFVKVPEAWIAALRQVRSGSTKQLALEILNAEFQRKNTGGQIVLTDATTGMPQTTRCRAARELASLGLIELKEDAKQAMRVVRVNA